VGARCVCRAPDQRFDAMTDRPISAVLRRCALCERQGTRGFMPSPGGGWVCRSIAACDRRIRGTGQTGVGAMRNYAR
jgi:hypothetical protein